MPSLPLPLPLPDTSRLHRLNLLLETGLALAREQRQAWLDALPPEHAELLPSLQAMLARADVETDDFLQHSPLPRLLADEEREHGPALQADQRIGPYRLVRELGQGGMATVWLAERDDGARRQVALKLPHVGWSAGVDRRVARERDILAALEHPHIARLYEADVTPEGRPWLAMEYVQGLPLDAHLRAHNPPLRERLRLFLQVTDAVAYAHSRLVVHRDLKPSNILISEQGEVRLLDFGVAKLLQGEDDPATQLTRQIGVAVTPDYAAPEQAAGQAVTAATDVYALGIVLYEMLSGVRPYSVGDVSIAQLETAIREAMVAPASTRATDARLARQLRGDIDTILAKALRKDADQRYASVDALAADIRRHLAGEPVLAQPPSWRYLAGKFMRRHRLGLATGSAVMFSLSAGLVAATWQWREAELQRQMAMAQIARSEAAADFTGTVLTETVDRGQPVTLEALLARSEQYVLATPDPLARAVAAHTLAAWHIDQGMDGAAEQLLATTLATLPAGFDPALRQALACHHAYTLHRASRSADALASMAAEHAALSNDPSTRSYCLMVRTWIANQMNEPELADRSAREALATLDAAGLSFPLRRAELTGELAYAHSLVRRSDEAEAEFRSAMQQLEAIGRADTELGRSILGNWANGRIAAGDPRGGLELHMRVKALAERRLVGQSLPAYLVHNIADTLRTLGRFDEAEREYQQAQTIAHATGAKQYEALALIGRAACANWRWRTDDAQRHLDDARQVLGAEFEQARAPAGEAWRMVQALVWLRSGRQLAKAEALMKQVMEDDDGQPVAATSVTAYQIRGELASTIGRVADGRRDLDRALEMARKQQLPGRPSRITGQVWLALGKHHQRTGDVTAARDAFAHAHAELVRALGDDSAFTREALGYITASR